MRISKHLLAAAALLAFAVSPAMAYEKGDWILRAGVGTVAPDSDNLFLPDFPAAGLNSTVEVDDGTSLTLMGTYMFTDNWAFDILAAWPFSHDINVTAVDAGTGDVVAAFKAGETDHLPPTFSIQYHFLPDSAFQPYVGAGVNYTTLFSTDVTQDTVDLGITSLDLDDSFGLALQLGADWVFGNNWLINVDFRYIDIESDASVSDGTTSSDIGTVVIDPYVYSINIGYRF